MAFESLTDRLAGVFKKLRGHGKLSEADIKAAMREVRMALLEADVNYKVAKEFCAKVSERAMGQEVMESLTPAQQVVKIVNEELIALMGGEEAPKLIVKNKGQTIIMLCGLQGNGKTTHAAKLAKYFIKQGRRPMLVACDIYRPAAIDQLKVVGKQAGAPVFTLDGEKPPVIAKKALAHAKDYGNDILILDTAGRLQIDEVLMQELVDIKSAVQPQEILFVADAMTGQDAVTVAEAFNKDLALTGVVLTKMDGDARGGAALSIKSVTGASVKYVGVGEKLSDLEVFHPERVAGRILGMGDMLTLIEKAQSSFEAEEAEAMAKKLQKATFDFEDFRTQMRRMKKIGSLENILKLIPGLGGLTSKLGDLKAPEQEMARTEAVINSMTMKERRNPDLINGSRRQRIAAGSGTTVAQVNQVLRQVTQMRQMMQQVMNPKAKGGRPKMPPLPKGMGGMGGMPGMGGLPGMGGMPGLPGAPGSGKSATKKKKTERQKRKKKR